MAFQVPECLIVPQPDLPCPISQMKQQPCLHRFHEWVQKQTKFRVWPVEQLRKQDLHEETELVLLKGAHSDQHHQGEYEFLEAQMETCVLEENHGKPARWHRIVGEIVSSAHSLRW